MEIPYAKHVLDNGLEVISHEDHRLPLVAVNLWYHVGSKNERPGLTGLAHLFEHLMFEGSEHYDRGYFHPLQEAGAALNGSTSADRTNYWEVVPTGALELALWMESDRMGYLLPALTEAKFDRQRDVVLNERRQNYENRPYGLANMAIVDALFPPDHPYCWLTIGRTEDLRAATLENAAAFFRAYYHPGNASLALAGDIEPDAGLALANDYFGGIERGPAIERPSAGAVIHGERRLLLEDSIELPRLYLSWHSPAMFKGGDAECDLTADMLGVGKSSRLYRALVYERRIATEVTAIQNSRELSGFFQVIATSAPGHTLAELEQVTTEEIERFAADGPTASELERSLAQAEAHFVYRVQTVGGFGGKSDQLNAYNVFLGDPGYFERDLGRYRQATPNGIRETARRSLRRDARVTLSVVPRGQRALAVPASDEVVVS